MDLETRDEFKKVNSVLKEILQKVSSFDKKFEDMDKGFEIIDGRFDTIDKGFKAVDDQFEAINEKFKHTDAQFDLVHAEILENREAINFLSSQTDKRFNEIDGIFNTQMVSKDYLDKKLSQLTLQINTKFESLVKKNNLVRDSRGIRYKVAKKRSR